jgi:uncharacterized protein YdhG (YjbR/CyaY superfamily)
LLKAFAADLKGYNVTKAAIQLPNDKPLPMDFIKRLVKFRKKEVDAVR